MPYEVRLSSEEKILNQITQDLAGKAFLFWRKFTVTLTNKRLHAYQKYMVSHGQKTFDLRDLDSIYQEKRFNGGFSFFLGLFAFCVVALLGVIAGGVAGNLEPVNAVFDFLGLVIWIAVFVLYFFRRLLIVHSRNDEMSIDVIRMPEEQLGKFVQSVLQQKESILVSTSTTSGAPATSGNAADKIKQLSELRAQGLITEQEFQSKKKEILKSL
jgi:hypothetical protein